MKQYTPENKIGSVQILRDPLVHIYMNKSQVKSVKLGKTLDLNL